MELQLKQKHKVKAGFFWANKRNQKRMGFKKKETGGSFFFFLLKGGELENKVKEIGEIKEEKNREKSRL